jgi:hypothetical protein
MESLTIHAFSRHCERSEPIHSLAEAAQSKDGLLRRWRSSQ